jgi:DNA-binding NarL/FixJ family response regulator
MESGLEGFSVRGLTTRETEVSEMLLSGLSNKEIASKIRVSVHTVRYHVHGILHKKSCANRIELLARSLRDKG